MSQVEIGLAKGDMFGRYRIASDGTAVDIGTQFTAYDEQANRLVDVLFLARRFGTSTALLERLTRANRAVVSLGQAGLAPFEHIGLREGQLYLVRKHLEGQTLGELLAEGGPLDSEAAVSMASQICNLLAPLHRAGMVHGGLSPHCILIGTDGRIEVADVGLAPALQAAPTPEGQPWGRFPYIAPEQAAGRKAHPATDVYLIGSLLYEMLTGRTVFVAADETGLALQHLRQEPVPLQARAPQAPEALAMIVHRALAKEPAARYRNAGQMAHILHSHLPSTLTVPAPPVRPAMRPGQGTRARRGDERAPAPFEEAGYPEPEPAGYAGPVAEEWDEEPVRVNWLTVGLLVAALIAVLGLIPLWRTVYRRYAVPEPAPTPVVYYMPGQVVSGLTIQAGGCAESRIRVVEARYGDELEECGGLFAGPAGGRGAVSGPLSERQPAGGETAIADSR